MNKDDKIRQLQNVASFEAGFEEIYVAFFKPLYLYARKITKSDDLAKDVVSDVFYNLWKSQTDFSKINELKSYLFIAVKNQVIRNLSRDPKDFSSVDTENYIRTVEKADPEELLLEKELLSVIQQTVSTLPPQCQLIFEMAKNKQMSYQEIADELGVSLSTVKTQVGRAIASIRQSIEERYEERGNRSVSGLGMVTIIIMTALLGFTS